MSARIVEWGQAREEDELSGRRNALMEFGPQRADINEFTSHCVDTVYTIEKK
jgi:hypothetical protein